MFSKFYCGKKYIDISEFVFHLCLFVKRDCKYRKKEFPYLEMFWAQVLLFYLVNIYSNLKNFLYITGTSRHLGGVQYCFNGSA